MEFSGDDKAWKDLLFLIPDLLELVVDSWREVSGISSCDKETLISDRFLICLRKFKNKRDLPLQIHREVSVPDETSGKEIGRNDFRFFPISTPSENIYFAFEAKRLRYPAADGMVSNTAEYVGQEGMMRFISGKYAAGLSAGGMIGYVMDGKSQEAIRGVRTAIQKKRVELRMETNADIQECSCLPNNPDAKETQHNIGRRFTLYHLFLSISKGLKEDRTNRRPIPGI